MSDSLGGDGGIVHLTLSPPARRSLLRAGHTATIQLTDASGKELSAPVTFTAFGPLSQASDASPAAAAPSRIATFGHTGFVSHARVAGVFLGCFGPTNCNGAVVLRAGHTVIAARRGTLVPADSGRLVQIPLNAQGRRLIAQDQLAVNVAVKDIHGPAAAATITLEHLR